MKNRMIFLGAGLAAVFWVLESAVHAFVFHEGAFIKQIFFPASHEFWMRSLVGCIIIAFGAYAQFDISRRRQAEEALQRAHDELELRVEERTRELKDDITERKRAEEALRESEKKYRDLYDNAPDMYHSLDENGIIIDCNKIETKMLGYEKEELIGRPLTDFLTEGSRRLFERDFLKLNKEKRQLNLEREFVRKDGTTFPASLNVFTEFDEDGNLLRTLTIARDITERKRAEEEMRTRLMKFSLVDGNLYMVKESAPDLSLRAFEDLLKAGYNGHIISRTPREKFEKTVNDDFEFLWLSESGGKKAHPLKLNEIKHRIENLPRKNAVLIDRLDYLISKKGFEKTLSFVQHLRELAYLSGNILILSIDPSTQDKRELRLLEKETLEIELQSKARLQEDLLEVLSFVYEQNAMGIKPSYTSIGKEVAASKPTVRKRVKSLVSSGHVSESKKGLYKVVELTEKGRNLFFS